MVDEENCEIVNQYFTSFNEAIVVLKYIVKDSSTEASDSLNIILDVYQAERQKSNKFEMEEKYETSGFLSSNGSKEVFFYSFRSLNNLVEITSSYNEKDLHFPYIHFRYHGQDTNPPVTMGNAISSKLNYGLWKAFLEVYSQNVLLLSQPDAVKIEKVGDGYASQNQDLTREVFESEPAVKLVNIFVSNNQLFIGLDYLN